MIIGTHDFAPGCCVPEFAHEISIGRDLADGIALGHRQIVGDVLIDAPEPEVLAGALREVLALGDVLQRFATLNQHAGNTAQAQIQRQTCAHRAAADDDNLAPLFLLLVHEAPRFFKIPRHGGRLALCHTGAS